ncbi:MULTISPECIES: hypothetical protein [Shewanella]|uniref:PilZ domain-containing protein n=1 Tax=Shewanella psychromarinicola TaxID=2487742 RepID=A0A3N4DYK4_9GAMM|nr:hypothetical protein [Shewanella psychromarinicola]AZG35904.1 hypothetical protein EGC80_14135 [Shewanella psychromarinicola]MCL1084212.1 hypothetical protein [Shewanella psychromarinicola]RPA22484.1 hypothetical protein EGC77_21885 [Shewanella psychromarinicola]
MIPDSNSYFNVPHNFNVYLTSWDPSHALPTDDELRDMQSVGLKLLTEVKSLEASCLLQLRHLDNDAKAVVDFLKLQSRKVDLVLQHVLEKEVQDGELFTGDQFGGSGISIISTRPLIANEFVKTHIYLHTELVALLCICQIRTCTAATNDTADTPSWRCELEFSQILEDDIEQLVRASLNVQQKMLKKRKQNIDKQRS